MRSVTLPYSEYKGHKAPIIPIKIKGKSDWLTIWVYVDSGATFSIFAVEEAERLGINYRQGTKGKVTVGDGSLIPVFTHSCPVKIGEFEIKATIAFSPRLGVGFNLLGRQGIFEKFNVTFSDSSSTITFALAK